MLVSVATVSGCVLQPEIRTYPCYCDRIASVGCCSPINDMTHTREPTSSRIPFSNIHIFHDVHQYNKTLIDLHYNYFMYLFSFTFPSFTLSELCLVSNPIPTDSTINLSTNTTETTNDCNPHISHDPPVVSLLVRLEDQEQYGPSSRNPRSREKSVFFLKNKQI